jgi:hypothetical protein
MSIAPFPRPAPVVVAQHAAPARVPERGPTAPQSDEAAHARRQLPRLKSAIDTGQRRFYCIVGD